MHIKLVGETEVCPTLSSEMRKGQEKYQENMIFQLHLMKQVRDHPVDKGREQCGQSCVWSSEIA